MIVFAVRNLMGFSTDYVLVISIINQYRTRRVPVYMKITLLHNQNYGLSVVNRTPEIFVPNETTYHLPTLSLYIWRTIVGSNH